jgi:hypothetical protein
MGLALSAREAEWAFFIGGLNSLSESTDSNRTSEGQAKDNNQG